jgi:O-antigen/teichoic acid export membrane protein
MIINFKSIIVNIKKSKLFGSFGIYIGSSLLNAAIPFLMLPILTKYLSVEDYGIVTMFTVLSSFILPFIGLSTAGAVGREFFNQDNLKFNVYSGNVVLLIIFSFFPIVILILFFSNFITKISNVPSNVIWLVLINSFFSVLVYVSLQLWQVQTKAKKYGIFQISQTILNILLSVILVVFFKYGWFGRIISQVLSLVIFGLLGFYIHYKDGMFNFKFNQIFAMDALKFGVPLIPHSLGAIMMSMSDRFIITNLTGLKELGLYSVGYSLGNIIGFLENSFNLAYAPWLFSKLNENDHEVKIKIVKYTYIYFVLILLITVILTLFSQIVFNFYIDKKFAQGQTYVFWISLSFAFSGMYKMVTNYIFYVKKTYYLSLITFSNSLLHILIAYFLVSKLGTIGAAIAAAISSFIFFLITWIYSNKIYNMPWNILKIFYKK